MAGRHHIAHREGLRRVGSEVDAPAGISAVIVDDLSPESEQFAVVVAGNLDFPILVALLGRSDKMLATVFDPFNRPSQDHCGDAERDVLRIKNELRPESTANVGRGNARIAFVPAEHVDQCSQGRMRCLRRAPICEVVGNPIVLGDTAAAFHRMTAAPMLPQRFMEDMRCGGEYGVNIAISDVEFRKQIVGAIPVDLRGLRFHCGAAIGNRGQRIIVDLDKGSRVLGDVTVLSDNDRHGFADMDDFVLRQSGAIAILLV